MPPVIAAPRSAIHGTGTNDIYEMGGLLKYQKVTGLTILCATVSIAGLPPFAGFWSKDEILLVPKAVTVPITSIKSVVLGVNKNSGNKRAQR